MRATAAVETHGSVATISVPQEQPCQSWKGHCRCNAPKVKVALNPEVIKVGSMLLNEDTVG